MAHDVFVSYSSKDKTITDSIVAYLEQNQLRCWYAPRDIKPSEDWANAISNAIEESKIFLIIFSGNSNQSRRVLDELNLAIAQELTILPFRIEKLEPDGAMRLHLSSRHWLDAYDPSWESHIRRLINTVSSYVESTIAEADVEVPQALVQQKKALINKRIRRILVGIAAAVLVIAVGWLGLASLLKTDDDTQASSSSATEQVTAPLDENGEDFLSVTQTFVASRVDQGQPTQQATHTAEAPVPYSGFSQTGPEGWSQYATEELSIWLPPGWDGGAPGSDLDRMLEAMEEANPDFAQYAAAIRQNPEAFLFWGYDLGSDVNFLTNMNIVKEQLPSSVTVSQYIDLLTQQLPAIYTIISTDTYLHGEYQAGEVISQVELQGVPIQQITFLLRGERGVYAMTLTTETSQFDQRLDSFRQIFQNVEIAPGY
jgi:hypothetical protein